MPVAALLAAAAVVPLPVPPATLARFEGGPVRPRPFAAAAVPRHPYMAPNGRSNIHVDGSQSDANTVRGRSAAAASGSARPTRPHTSARRSPSTAVGAS